MGVQYRHTGNDKAKYNQSGGDQENGNRDFHPVWEISFARRQMPVKGNQADIQPIDNDTKNGPDRRPFDYAQIPLAHTDGIEKARQGHKSQ